jgi:hypothetical protein
MAIKIKTPSASFIQFDTDLDTQEHPIFGTISVCLPVIEEDDLAFQFVLEADTKAEADQLAAIASTNTHVGIASNYGYQNTLLQFSGTPERFRLSDLQVLYNWTDGIPGFKTVVKENDCFVLEVVVLLNAITYKFHSNCFERLTDSAFTSIIDYGSDDNAFGFNYCASGALEPDSLATCAPTVIEFTSETNLTIPYTASLKAAYGSTPTVQVWIYEDSGDLVNAGIQAQLDAFPPNTLSFDFGGVASGIIVIK